VIYAKAFFDLQLQFAHKITIVSGLPLARALLDYTNLYIRLGLGRGFDPAHPAWREYLAGLQDANDAREWTYRFSERLECQASLDGVGQCFPFQVLSVEASAREFYDFYGIKSP
jgi:hypothetical protein